MILYPRYALSDDRKHITLIWDAGNTPAIEREFDDLPQRELPHVAAALNKAVERGYKRRGEIVRMALGITSFGGTVRADG